MARWLGRALNRWGIRVLLAVLLFLALLPATILALKQTISANDDARMLRENDLLDRVARDAMPGRTGLLEIRAEVAALARGRHEALRERCEEALAQFLMNQPRISAVRFTGAQGSGGCAAGPEIGAVFPGLEGPQSPEYWLTGGGPDPDVPRRLAITAPSTGEAGDVGLVTALVSETFLQGLLQQSDTALWTNTALVGPEGEIIAAAGTGAAAREWLRWHDVARIRATGFGAVLEYAGDRADGEVVLRVPLIEGSVWLAAGLPARSAYATLDTMHAILIVLPFAMILLGVLIAYLAADRLIARHILYLSRVAQAYGHGRLNLRARVVEREAPRELVALSENLSTMAGRLRDREESLTQSLDDNRSLLFEVYHRVKNNLQMMVSLTNLQIRDTDAPELVRALRQVQARIYGLSVVHQGLQLSNFSEIVRLDTMLEKLLEHLDVNWPDPDSRVQAELDEVTIGAERAVPVGLLAAEALNDPAFDMQDVVPDDCLRVVLEDLGERGVRLAFRRSGSGVPGEPGPLATRLMKGFARQLRGTLDIRRSDGALSLELIVPHIVESEERAGVLAGRRALAAEARSKSS